MLALQLPQGQTKEKVCAMKKTRHSRLQSREELPHSLSAYSATPKEEFIVFCANLPGTRFWLQQYQDLPPRSVLWRIGACVIAWSLVIGHCSFRRTIWLRYCHAVYSAAIPSLISLHLTIKAPSSLKFLEFPLCFFSCDSLTGQHSLIPPRPGTFHNHSTKKPPQFHKFHKFHLKNPSELFPFPPLWYCFCPTAPRKPQNFSSFVRTPHGSNA